MTDEIKSAAPESTPLLDKLNEAFESERVSAGELLGQELAKVEDPAPVKAAVEAATSEKKEETPEADPAKGGDEAPESDEEKSAYEKARTALRRDKVPVSVLDGMDRKALVEWGLSRVKAQGDADNAFRELGELKRAKEADSARAESTAKTEPVVEQPKIPDAKAKALREQFGDEAGDAVVQLLTESLASQRAEFQREIASLRESFAPVADTAVRLEIQQARKKLAGEFPQLEDEGEFKFVADKMQKLVPSGAYEGIEDLMREASLIRFGSKAIQENANRSKSDYRARDRGVSKVAVTSSPKPVSKQDRAMAEVDSIFAKHGLN